MTREFRDLASPAALRDAIESLPLGGGRESVSLSDARGRVLAERVDADIDVPGFDRAAVDGYAVRARDTFEAGEATPVSLTVAGRIDAGEKATETVGEGEAVAIATGAVLPAGANATVMREHTDGPGHETGDDVAVRSAVTPGEGVMAAGADVATGTRALGAGTRLTARELGLLAALGHAAVPVRAEPTVGLLSTGEELVQPGGDLDSDAGQIYDVNTTTLAAAVSAAGGAVVRYPHVGDDRDDLESMLRTAADETDLVLSSGSTSAGHRDVIHRVIDEEGDLVVHGAAVKPGKPTLVGTLDGSAFVGLPGYPVSALMVFREYVAPAIRAAAGVPEPRTATVQARMSRRERFDEGRRRLVPVGLVEDAAGATIAYPVDKGSGATTSLVEADGVVAVPAATAYLSEGETVEASLFTPGVRIPSLLGVGETDPAVDRLLDHVDHPRYLAVGSDEGVRRLDEGIPDVCVSADPVAPPDAGVELGRVTREWGLAVPPDNPDGILAAADLSANPDLTVACPADSALRASLAAELGDGGDEPGRGRLAAQVEWTVKTVHSPGSAARAVAAGDAVAGLCLRATVDGTGLSFVPLGTQTVTITTSRPEKPGVRGLVAAISDELPGIVADLPGYDVGERKASTEGSE